MKALKRENCVCDGVGGRSSHCREKNEGRRGRLCDGLCPQMFPQDLRGTEQSRELAPSPQSALRISQWHIRPELQGLCSGGSNGKSTLLRTKPCRLWSRDGFLDLKESWEGSLEEGECRKCLKFKGSEAF